jgi:hypothetical protein
MARARPALMPPGGFGGVEHPLVLNIRAVEYPWC